MKVRIIKDRFGGMGWRAEPGVLHLGGVGTAGVESLSFALPEEWSGMAVTLHIEQEGGTLPQPVLLDESREVTIDRRFTAARQGLWMLLAQSVDGYTAMSCPAKYDCYETIGLSGTVEDVDPSVYAQFVALVQQAVNTAMNEGAAAKDAAKTARLRQMPPRKAQPPPRRSGWMPRTPKTLLPLRRQGRRQTSQLRQRVLPAHWARQMRHWMPAPLPPRRRTGRRTLPRKRRSAAC